MKHTKIAVIGTGNVGATIAYSLMMRNEVAEILLVDKNIERCKGEFYDLTDSLSFCRASNIQNSTYKEACQADIIIICAGRAQKPGESRLDLLKSNSEIIRSIINQMKPIRSDSIIIMVTNPVDLMTLVAQQEAGLPKNQIFGSGTFLDTQRLRGIISQKLQIAQQSIHAYILGEHGKSQFAAWSSANIGGIPINNFKELDQQFFENAEICTIEKVNEIIKCKGFTNFGIASCVSAICEDIIFDKKRIAPVSCYVEKFGVCLSLPAVLGEKGIEKILDLKLDHKEEKKLEESAKKLKDIKLF